MESRLDPETGHSPLISDWHFLEKIASGKYLDSLFCPVVMEGMLLGLFLAAAVIGSSVSDNPERLGTGNQRATCHNISSPTIQPPIVENKGASENGGAVFSRRARAEVSAFCERARAGAFGSRNSKDRIAAAWLVAYGGLDVPTHERERAAAEHAFFLAMETADPRGLVSMASFSVRRRDRVNAADQARGDARAGQGGGRR